MDPLRLRLQKALTTTLEAVAFVGENSTTMAGRVFRGRSRFGSSDSLPMISILEAAPPSDRRDEPVASTAGVTRYELVIQGFVEDDQANPTDPAHILMALVKTALAAEKKRLRPDRSGQRPSIRPFGLVDNPVTDITIGSGTVQPADETSSTAYFWLFLTVSLVEDWENPYGTGNT